MKLTKVLLLSLVVFQAKALTYQGYHLLVSQYNKVALDESTNFKTRLSNVTNKLKFIDDILDNTKQDNIFSSDLNLLDVNTSTKLAIKEYLTNNGLSCENLKSRQKYLEQEKRALERFKIFHEAKDSVIEKIDKARKCITKVSDYASAAFIIYGLYNIFQNPINEQLRKIYDSPKLMAISDESLLKKAATLTGMLAISCHYLGK